MSRVPGIQGLVTVVITNYNRCDDLRIALQSIEAQDYPEVDVVVVDNASTDGSRAMMAAEFPSVRIIALDENTGMDGYSYGFREAEGEIVFQMDNDSRMPDRRVLSAVVDRFHRSGDDVAVIATRVEEYRPDTDDVEQLRSRDPDTGPLNTGGFHSGGVAFRRAALDRVGYYDRDVFLYGSELFLQMKFLAAGYTVAYYPEILMLHTSSGVSRSARGIYYELRNRYWFMRRFASASQRLRFLPSMIVHDAVYAAWKRAPFAALKALVDGFGRLPDGLRQPLRSTQPDFVAKVDEVGRTFRLAELRRRTSSRLSTMPRKDPGSHRASPAAD